MVMVMFVGNMLCWPYYIYLFSFVGPFQVGLACNLVVLWHQWKLSVDVSEGLLGCSLYFQSLATYICLVDKLLICCVKMLCGPLRLPTIALNS